MSEGVLVQNGKFRVFENGSIFKVKNGKETKIRPVKGRMGRNGDVLRLTTSYSQNGKQKHFLISSLVAEAYLPKNEEHTNSIKYIDGNPENCHVENLRRETKAERANNVKAAHASLRAKQVICPKCKNKKVPYKGNKEHLCKQCFDIEMTKNNKLETIKKEFQHVNHDLLDERQQKILNMRLDGKSLEEISNDFNLTRERIRVILIDIQNIEKILLEKGERKNLSIDKNIEYISKKLKVLEIKKESLERELNFLKQKKTDSPASKNQS